MCLARLPSPEWVGIQWLLKMTAGWEGAGQGSAGSAPFPTGPASKGEIYTYPSSQPTQICGWGAAAAALAQQGQDKANKEPNYPPN